MFTPGNRIVDDIIMIISNTKSPFTLVYFMLQNFHGQMYAYCIARMMLPRKKSDVKES